MLVANDERFTLEITHRKENSSYEYEDAPYCSFKGRPASNIEVKEYRIMKGVNGGTDSTFVYGSNIPTGDIKIDDQVKFMGKVWVVKSIGYYYDKARIHNPNIYSEEQIRAKCPKGLNLQ